MNKHFKKVAVLGAGVMGVQIAALMANMNVPVILFELPAKEKDKSALSKQAIKRLTKLKPPPFATNGVEHFIEAANYDDDLQKLGECDLIIEAIAENLEWKKDLYGKITGVMKEDAILATNTSGLSINLLAGILPEKVRQNFIGIHFFNPPRYMHLVELIPCNDTNNDVLIALEHFLVTTLGKGIVVAKDTPNFIANRIGVFNLIATIHHAQQLNIPFEIVDQITGKPMARAKSGTFRTMDVVGLDVLAHVIKTMEDNLRDDPWLQCYALPDFIKQLIDEGALGQKAGKGIYIKKGKQVFNPKENQYVDANGQMNESLTALFKEKDLAKRFKALQESSSDQAQFVYLTLLDLFHYCCVHLQDIASNTADVDLAIRWGFGWQQGPFEIMQTIGWTSVIATLEQHIKDGKTISDVALPAWTKEISKVHSQNGSWSPTENSYLPLRDNPVYQRQIVRENIICSADAPGTTLFDNDHTRLWQCSGDIAVLSFKTKMHSINESVLDSVIEACERAGNNHTALVLWHPSAPFSVGADLSQVGEQLQAGNIAGVENMVAKFQQASMALKHCRVPTVAAVQGLALGGGCEFQMHCNLTVVAMESYIGLVEAGVGLLPAAGGLKELALKAMHLANDKDIFPHIQAAFELTAMAKVSVSGSDAKTLGLLSPVDVVVANPHEILHVALHQARALAERANQAPRSDELIKVTGKPGKATLMMIATNMLEGLFISPHDYKIAESIATVLTGGDVESGSLVSQDWLLKLERDSFIELISTEKTQQRIVHTLKTGKPLRN